MVYLGCLSADLKFDKVDNVLGQIIFYKILRLHVSQSCVAGATTAFRYPKSTEHVQDVWFYDLVPLYAHMHLYHLHVSPTLFL